MKNFARVIRLAMRYRFTIIASFICSFMVGVLWGCNIVAIYPFVEVVFRRESFHDSSDQRVIEKERLYNEQSSKIEQLESRHGDAELARRPELQDEIRVEKEKLAAAQKSLDRERWRQKQIHAYLPADPFLDLAVVITALIFGTILKSAFLAAHVVLVARIRQWTVFDLRNQLFRKTLDMDVSSFGEHRTSGLMSRFTHDIKILEDGLGMLFGQAVREPLKMLACLVGAAIISWRLLLLSLIVTPIGFLMLRWLNRAIKNTSGRSMDVIAEMYARLSESFNGIKAVKAFSMEEHERRRFHDTGKEYAQRCMRMSKYIACFKPVSEIMGIAVVSVAILLGAHLVLNQETHVFGVRISNEPLSAGALMVFFAMLAGIADPARKISDIYALIIGGIAASDRIYDLMDRESSIQEPSEPKQVAAPHASLKIANVNFHYRKGEPVLNDISLEIPFGETVVLVGPNGCGKSTLVNLLPRFFDPVSGTICLDSVDLQEMSFDDLRSRIGLVTQETLLFDETILNNIRYGALDASETDVARAAKRAHADEFITQQLEDGYQTVVGQGGGWLSGGQRQRIALARAILRDPEILILDEATSHIDVQSEELIHQALKTFVHGRTAIMVSHRVSTLAMADRIVVMENGRITDTGTRDELYNRCKYFQRLFDAGENRAA